jgi:hypothetical protein
MNKRFALQLVLWSICIYHVVLGACGFLSENLAVRLADVLFGMKVDPTPQLSYIVKLLGIYAILFGLMAATAARKPERHPVLLNLIIVLYGLRILNKLLYEDLLVKAFAAPPSRVWIDVACLAAFGVAVALLKPRAAVAGEK